MATTVFHHRNLLEETTVENVDEIFDGLRLSRTDMWGDSIPSKWVFRGQSSAAWGLLPGVWRSDVLAKFQTQIDRIKNFVQSKLHRLRAHDKHNMTLGVADDVVIAFASARIFEEIILQEFESLLGDGGFAEASLRYRINWKEMLESGSILSLDAYKYNVDAVAIAQHAGLPTRLLDWTLDPLKALVFSLRDDESEQDACVWAIDHTFIETMDDPVARTKAGLAVVKFVRGRRFGNSFLNAQDGCFTYMDFMRPQYTARGAFPELQDIIIEDAQRVGHTSTVIKKILFHLSVSDKLELRRRLYRERRTLFHLMPSFERCAEEAKAVIRLGVRDRLT